MRLIFTALMACVTAGLGSAQTQTFLQSGTGVSNAGLTSTNRTLGYLFQTGANPISVTSLGAFDFQSDGLAGTVDIGIWNANTQVLLGSVTVPAGTTAPLQGGSNFQSGTSGFRYVSLTTPVALDPGTAYTVGALTHGADPYAVSVTNLSTGPGMSMIDAVFSNPTSTTLTMPRSFNSGFSPGYVGPNMQYTVMPVPEPASMLGMFAAFIGAVHFGRRKLTSRASVTV